MIEKIYESPILWQMSPQERASLFYLFSQSDPGGSVVEVGTYYGGSLQHFSEYFNKVYSLDISHKRIGKYLNVELITGDSRQTLPPLIKELNDRQEPVAIFLIDANHEYQYVLHDLTEVLNYQPVRDTIVLVHDSWYVPSRQAICACPALRENPHVHFVDTDFCSGNYIDGTNTLIGGFCLVLMKPSVREGSLQIRQSNDFTFRRMNGQHN